MFTNGIKQILMKSSMLGKVAGVDIYKQEIGTKIFWIFIIRLLANQELYIQVLKRKMPTA